MGEVEEGVGGDIVGPVLVAGDDDARHLAVERVLPGFRVALHVGPVEPLDDHLGDRTADPEPDGRADDQDVACLDVPEDSGPFVPFAHIGLSPEEDVVVHHADGLGLHPEIPEQSCRLVDQRLRIGYPGGFFQGAVEKQRLECHGVGWCVGV